MSATERLHEAVEAFGYGEFASIDVVLEEARIDEAVRRLATKPYDGWLRALGRDDVPSAIECAQAYVTACNARGRARRVGAAQLLMLCSARSAQPVLLHDVADEFDLVGSYLSGGLTLAGQVIASCQRYVARPIRRDELQRWARQRREFETYRRTRTTALGDLLATTQCAAA